MILPLLVLRRLDAVLERSKAKVLETQARLEGRTSNPEPLLKGAWGQPFYNTSPCRPPRELVAPGGFEITIRDRARGRS